MLIGFVLLQLILVKLETGWWLMTLNVIWQLCLDSNLIVVVSIIDLIVVIAILVELLLLLWLHFDVSSVNIIILICGRRQEVIVALLILVNILLFVRSSKERVIKVQVIVIVTVAVWMVDLMLVMYLMLLLIILLLLVLLLLLMLIELLGRRDEDGNSDFLHNWERMGNFLLDNFFNRIRHLDFLYLNDRIWSWHLDFLYNLNWIRNLSENSLRLDGIQ